MSIHLDYDALERLKQELVASMAELSEVTNGAYITQNMFPESKAGSADATTTARDTLVQCAEMMWEIYDSTITYFEKIIADFVAADITNAVAAERLINSPNGPVNRPTSKPPA